MMRRLEDQMYVLEAIAHVRQELKRASEAGANDIEIGEIMMRLTSLYVLLNTDRLIEAIKVADTRANYRRRA